MSPADLSPKDPLDEPSISPRNDSAEKWTLTKEGLDKLLDHLSPDPEEAGRRYVALRLRLTRYFEWQSCPSPERQVDKTLDRVACKLDEGKDVINLVAYSLTVAGFVIQEWRRENRPMTELEKIPDIAADPPLQDEEKEARLRCLDECLDKLPIESRNLILGYYCAEVRAKVRRREIAEALSIPLNALRIRAHRIRNILEECVKKCLQSETKTAQ